MSPRHAFETAPARHTRVARARLTLDCILIAAAFAFVALVAVAGAGPSIADTAAGVVVGSVD